MWFILDGKVYDHQMVRTDAKEIKLDAFIVPSQRPSQEEGRGDKGRGDDGVGGACKRKLANQSHPPAQHRKRKHCPVHLTSVKNLIDRLYGKKHQGMLLRPIIIIATPYNYYSHTL